ncbi:MAG: Uma2 family endonuclease [Bryobacterales bacterium]|nr:Uma2 family endonuclease [Bryobacterales bacterium]
MSMIAAPEQLIVRTRADFDRLPDEGFWEVVDGRAILLPPPSLEHQIVSHRLTRVFDNQLEALKCGYVLVTLNVFIPMPLSSHDQARTRVPDLIVFRDEPHRYLEAGNPPELVIEILSTKRGNVEHTEKIDDYARAGIGEYWIVDPFNRTIEVYWLEEGEYSLVSTATTSPIRPRAFPISIDPSAIWA